MTKVENLAPVVLFVFNRPKHTLKTITSLSNNILSKDTALYIYSDGPRNDNDIENVKEVRNIINSIKGFKSVTLFERNENQGLAKSVIQGVSNIIGQYGNVIVVEDDIVTSPYFLTYMNEALKYYENEDKIFSISGYSFPIDFPKSYNEDVYAFYRISSWGWATWLSRWKTVDWKMKSYKEYFPTKESKRLFRMGGSDLVRQLKLSSKGYRDSWLLRFQYSCSKQNKLCLYPRFSKVNNIGTDGTGRHFTHKTHSFDVSIDNSEKKVKFIKIENVDLEIYKQYSVFFSFKNRIRRRIKYQFVK